MDAEVLDTVYALLEAYKSGRLGGEKCRKMKILYWRNHHVKIICTSHCQCL